MTKKQNYLLRDALTLAVGAVMIYGTTMLPQFASTASAWSWGGGSRGPADWVGKGSGGFSSFLWGGDLHEVNPAYFSGAPSGATKHVLENRSFADWWAEEVDGIGNRWDNKNIGQRIDAWTVHESHCNDGAMGC